MDPTKEVVEFNDPADDSVPFDGRLRQIAVTAHRTQQHIRTAVFAVPESYDEIQVADYLERTFDFLGLYEVFDQEQRYCIRVDIEEIIGDEPDLGYEWREATDAEKAKVAS